MRIKRKRQILLKFFLFFLLITLASCQSSSPPALDPKAEAPPPPAPGVVGNIIGQTLDETDRARAIAAQQAAVATGLRKSWRGAHGVYGFIIPSAETNGCRDYTHKIFINGRPQEARGQACLEKDAWRVMR